MPDPIQSASSTSATNLAQANQPPPQREVTAAMGDTPQRIAQENGVNVSDLLKANPHLNANSMMLGGERLTIPTLPSSESPNNELSLTNGSNVGIAGATGREGAVQALMGRAYTAGQTAPQSDFSGSLIRTSATRYEAGAFDANRESAGRYNAGSSSSSSSAGAPDGTRLIYASQSVADNRAEMGAYKSPTNPTPMANQSMIDFDFKATVDAQGRGGVADLPEGMRQQNLPREAFTIPKGSDRLDFMHRLTGEHPYSLSQQAGKGALDAGAAAIRAPSAVAPGDQINILTANAKPGSVTPTNITPFDADGNAMPARSATNVNPMTTAASTPAGQLPKAPGTVDSSHRMASGNPIEPRSNSVRYGAAGGVAGSLINDGIRAARGEGVSAAEVARNAGTSGVVGAGSARATEMLASQLGGRPVVSNIKAGGIIGGAVEAVVSTSRNADLYENKEITASQATANVAVDTGVAVAAGASGAAIGAAVGSIVPVAGTAVGAVVGFVAGMGVHYGIQAIGNATGAIQGAKDWAANNLASFEKPLSQAWDGVVSAKSAVGDAVSGAWNKLSSIF